MALLYRNEAPKKEYWDKQSYTSIDEQREAMTKATTIYVGNVSFFTTELQIWELFSSVGHVERVIMGLDRLKKTPCGFCFVKFNRHAGAANAVNYVTGTKLDQRVIRCELDGGFKEGRQYGRGASGGQVRDERRSKDDYDAGRGGFGRGNNNTPMKQQHNSWFNTSTTGHHKRRRDMSTHHDGGPKDNNDLSGDPNLIEEDRNGSNHKRSRQEDNDETESKEETNPRFRDHSDDEGEDEA